MDLLKLQDESVTSYPQKRVSRGFDVFRMRRKLYENHESICVSKVLKFLVESYNNYQEHVSVCDVCITRNVHVYNLSCVF